MAHSSYSSTWSNARRERGVGADFRRVFRLGVWLPRRETFAEEGPNEVRFMAGVKPVEHAVVSCRKGPGSEKRTRFLDFRGVLLSCFPKLDRTSSDGLVFDIVSVAVACLVRRETGSSPNESETVLFLRFLHDNRVSILRL